MPALSAMDLAMFVLETRERPFNIGPLVLLRPPEGFRGNFADKLVAKLLKRPPGPPFNYELKLSLTSISSVEPMAKPNLAAHVHRMTLADASMEDLLAEVCKLHETLLDRSGMLWQFFVIDGLADGRVALYGKVHHGLIDGRTFVMAMTNCMSADPKDKEVRAMWEAVPRSPAKATVQASIAQRVMTAGAQAAGAVRSAAGVYKLLAEQGLRSLGIGNASPLPFTKVTRALDGGAVSARRSYAFCTLPLTELKAIGKANGATVNDMLLTVLDMGMHGYLGKRSKALRAPLVADMPVALSAGAKGGNQIALLQFPLGKAAATVAERLAAIRAETGRVKGLLKKSSSDILMLHTTLVHALPVVLERVGVKASLRLSNLVVSNPFGIEGKRYAMGAEVELALPMSVVAAGQKLNITAVTLGDRLQIGFLAMPDAVPHIERLARMTQEAFDEMKVALGRPGAASVPKPAAKPKVARKVARKAAGKPAPRRSRVPAKS